jgi:hypothetical protein
MLDDEGRFCEVRNKLPFYFYWRLVVWSLNAFRRRLFSIFLWLVAVLPPTPFVSR